MKFSESGYTLVELIISISITVLITGVTGVAIFQILKNNDRNTDKLTAAREVENAGDWISRDAQMALTITTTNVTAPVFLNLTWTENVTHNPPIYDSANYSIESVSGDIGIIKRTYYSTAGVYTQTLIAQDIYYDPTDNSSTSASYQSPVLIVTITSSVGDIMETRKYKVTQRPNTA